VPIGLGRDPLCHVRMLRQQQQRVPEIGHHRRERQLHEEVRRPRREDQRGEPDGLAPRPPALDPCRPAVGEEKSGLHGEQQRDEQSNVGHCRSW
jgi:hypothetical protein